MKCNNTDRNNNRRICKILYSLIQFMYACATRYLILHCKRCVLFLIFNISLVTGGLRLPVEILLLLVKDFTTKEHIVPYIRTYNALKKPYRNTWTQKECNLFREKQMNFYYLRTHLFFSYFSFFNRLMQKFSENAAMSSFYEDNLRFHHHVLNTSYKEFFVYVFVLCLKV